MNYDDILLMVEQGESGNLEFKKSTSQLSAAAETLCGFLNDRGGTAIIGVSPEGKIIGQDVSDQTQQEVAAVLRRFEPAASIALDYVSIPDSDKQLVVMTAPARGDGHPYVWNGRPFQRIGTTTSVMPQETYKNRLFEASHKLIRWETTPANGVTVSDLDHEEILRTVRLGISAGRLPESTGTNVVNILTRLGLIKNGQVLNAAVVLFGRQFVPDYPQCYLRLARFNGIEKTEFLDNRHLHGNGFMILDEALRFLQRHLPVAGRLEPGSVVRKDEPLFPVNALREALVNAICHRDYLAPGGSIGVAVFDDRVEIWSTGLLPSGICIDDLSKNHESKPRNPLIADVFYLRGLVERWGEGTRKIISACLAAGRPKPEFIEQSGAIGVRFLVSTPGKSIVELKQDLTPRHTRLLEVLVRLESATRSEIKSGMKDAPSDRTLQRDLDTLRRLGIIGAYGHGRNIVYRLKKP